MPNRDVAPVLPTVPAATARRGRHGALATVAACAAVASAVLALLAHRVAYFPIDLVITRSVQSAPIDWLDLPLRVLNAVGFAPYVSIAYGSIVLGLFVAGRRWEAVASGIAAIGGVFLTPLVKMLVARPRPPIELVDVERHLRSSSFPAGHVLNLTAFAGFLCYLAWVNLAPSWRRTALIVTLLATIVLMGLARIHAGEHWPSDVMGGFLLGVVWLTVTVALYRWGRRKIQYR
jgi:membrane-associated phospholipid phosphatase